MSTQRDRQAGFTLIEIVVVMGLLASFVLMLVQLTGSGVDMFTKGQRGQDLADRAMLASHAIEDELGRMVGPVRTDFEPHTPDARLIVNYVNRGFARDGEEHDRIQMLRATVGLTEAEETELLVGPIREAILEELGDVDEAALEKMLEAELAGRPRFGRGDLLLLPWPIGDDGVF
ncbi:MAG: type II secretion system protein, partial [Planctomycetes bacterium]|nr:type II secretion system protein [Planctomycetota bacterium]